MQTVNYTTNTRHPAGWTYSCTASILTTVSLIDLGRRGALQDHPMLADMA